MKREKNKICKSVRRKIESMGYIIIDKRDIEKIKNKYIMIGMNEYFKRYMEKE